MGRNISTKPITTGSTFEYKIGDIKEGFSNDPNWLECDGRIITKSSYPELSVLLGANNSDIIIENLKFKTKSITTLYNKYFEAGGSSFGFANNKYLAVNYESSSNEYGIISTDGLLWTETALPSSTYPKVIGGGANLVLADRNRSWVFNGLTWDSGTAFSNPGGTASKITGEYGNGAYVISVQNSVVTDKKPVYVSTNGLTWARNTNGPAKNTNGTTENLSHIRFNEDRFIDRNDRGFSTSLDGYSWTFYSLTEALGPQSTSYANSLYKVAYGNGMYFVLLQTDMNYQLNSRYAISHNGIDWDIFHMDFDTFPHNPDDIIFVNGYFILQTYANSALYFSKDGINWISKVTRMTNGMLDKSNIICVNNKFHMLISPTSNYGTPIIISAGDYEVDSLTQIRLPNLNKKFSPKRYIKAL